MLSVEICFNKMLKIGLVDVFVFMTNLRTYITRSIPQLFRSLLKIVFLQITNTKLDVDRICKHFRNVLCDLFRFRLFVAPFSIVRHHLQHLTPSYQQNSTTDITSITNHSHNSAEKTD